MSKITTKKTIKKNNGYRSAFEYGIALNLKKRNIEFEYETVELIYFTKVRNGSCKKCGAKSTYIQQQHVYTPDWKIGSILVESKGLFTSANRIKALAVRDNNPGVEIKFLFMQDNFINKAKTTRYSDWCNSHGFDFAFKVIPEGWVNPDAN